VRTVAASIDGVTKETYEKIRVPARWDQILSRLDLLREFKKRKRVDRPRLRIIFTWMKSNRDDLRDLPAFAAHHGAVELDVRYVAPTVGVDVSSELLSDEDPGALRTELGATAREAVRRGLRLSSYPDFETAADRPRNPLRRVARRLWRLKAGIDKLEHVPYAWRQRLYGCAYPDRYYVIRPNGAVTPCIYWEGDPIGMYPTQDLSVISRSRPLASIRDGLRRGAPIGSCASCTERRSALYRLASVPPAADATGLPTHPR
jgi:MoaA/NifB/PqqE/SkfB family radical SAM enzyme